MRNFTFLSSGLLALTVAASAMSAPRLVVDVPNDLRVSKATPIDSARTVLRKSANIPGGIDLALNRDRSIGALRVLRFRQTHMGVPVFGRGAAMAFDAQGVSRLASSKIEQTLPASVVPKIDASEAASIASAASGLPATSANTRVLIWPTQAGGRLAYSVLPPNLFPLPYAPAVIVDADTGEVLSVHNLVRYKNQANVFKTNPVRENNKTIVDELLIDDPFDVPQSELLESYNCVDTHKVQPIDIMGFALDLHMCELLQNAVADADNGDFLQYVYENDTEGGDPFAQISIYYHAAKAYKYFKQFDPDFELEETSKPLFLISNLMMPAGFQNYDLSKMANPDLDLVPFDNAFSMGYDPEYGAMLSMIWPQITGGGLAFGQGAKVDYSYDGDVVYHEFTHSVVGTTIGLSGYGHLDEQGGTVAPGAMNEALADFFAASITGDSNVGSYAGSDGAIRGLVNDHKCPSHLSGEVHADSMFFSAGLWAAREFLDTDAQKFTFDETIFSALNTAPSGDLGFEDLAALFVTALGQSTLGATAADALREAFTARGVLETCDRTLVYEDSAISSKAPELSNLFIMPPRNSFGRILAYAPGVFQVEVPIQQGAAQIDISFVFANPSAGGGNNPLASGTPTPALIASFDEPLRFDWSNTSKTDNSSVSVDATVADPSNPVSSATAIMEIPENATKAYVMVVNKGNGEGYFGSLKFDMIVSNDPADAGPDAPIESGDDPSDQADDDDGCSCRTVGNTSTPPNASWLAALAALTGMGLVRRRRDGVPG